MAILAVTVDQKVKDYNFFRGVNLLCSWMIQRVQVFNNIYQILQRQNVSKDCLRKNQMRPFLSVKVSAWLGQYSLHYNINTKKYRLVHPNDKVQREERTGTVYKSTFSDCSSCYVGKTGRTLYDRLKEHKRALILNNPFHLAVAEHALNTGHIITLNGMMPLPLTLKTTIGQERWKNRFG